MAYFSRLILIFTLFLSHSHLAYSQTLVYKYAVSDQPPWAKFPTIAQACQDWVVKFVYPPHPELGNAQYSGGSLTVEDYGASGNCIMFDAVCTRNGAPCGTDNFQQPVHRYLVDEEPPECSANQELDPETNTCVCKDTNGKPAGSFAVNGDTYVGCNDGCKIVLSSGSYSASTNKTYGTWQQTGESCAPSPDSPGVDDPDSDSGKDAGKCPAGTCPGTFNGQSMCVPCKGKESSDSSSSENTSETPNGASAPSSSSSESSSGSKSTECEGGVCITKEKVVVVNPDGSTTEKEKETTESISDFCAKNPKAAICKAVEEGRWGGSCSGGFQCSGDAVQCAQAQAAWKSACASDVSGMSDQINTGTAAMAAGAASGLGIPGGSDVFDLGSRLSDVPLFGSSGGCPSDVSVNVGGTSYTIAFSAMCGQLQVLGVALMGFAYLIAGFIVFRGDRS